MLSLTPQLLYRGAQLPLLLFSSSFVCGVPLSLSKLTLSSLTSSYRSNAALNANFDDIETAVENTLSRDGTAPNAMGAVLDMGAHRVINAGAPTLDSDLVTKVYADSLIAGSGVDATALKIVNDLGDLNSASAGRTNLGVALGVDVLTHDANLQSFVDTFLLPTSDGTIGQIVTTDGAGNLTLENAPASGAGDLLAANNLSDLGSATTSRANLGLGDAAEGDIGSEVLAHDTNLQTFVDTFTLPVSDGTSGHVVTTDGGGNLTLEPPSDALPVGSIVDYAGVSAPSGWLFAFGQTVSRATYAALFTAIGTLYGVGDGSTTFGVPDLRGRSRTGRDDMGGAAAGRVTDTANKSLGDLDASTLGETGGDAATAWRTADNRAASGSGGRTLHILDGDLVAVATDSNTYFPNLPPTMVLNTIIKV